MTWRLRNADGSHIQYSIAVKIQQLLADTENDHMTVNQILVAHIWLIWSIKQTCGAASPSTQHSPIKAWVKTTARLHFWEKPSSFQTRKIRHQEFRLKRCHGQIEHIYTACIMISLDFQHFLLIFCKLLKYIYIDIVYILFSFLESGI